jgi:hypothetical protein
MLAVRFGADQAHFGKPLKMRTSSDSCAVPKKGTDLPLLLTNETIRRHLEGEITVGL